MFISSYNEDGNHRSKLKPIQFWNEIVAKPNSVIQSADSGVFIIHCLYSLVCEQELHIDKFDPTTLRQQLMMETLEYSDNVKDICVICFDKNDDSTSTAIAWANCKSCRKWYHNSCINISDSITGDYTCKLCNEHIFENQLAGLINL